MRHGKRCTASKFIGAELGNLMNGFSSTDSVPTQQTGVNLFAEFNNRNYTFRVTPFVNDSLNVDSETNDFPILQDMFPNLQPIKPFFSNYSGVEMVLGPVMFHVIELVEDSRKSKLSCGCRCPLTGFSVALFIRQLLFQSPPLSALVPAFVLEFCMGRLNMLIPIQQLINVLRNYLILPCFITAAVTWSKF